MLTVKKFGTVFNLSYGGYVAAMVGIALAVLTIIVFPPDMDLSGMHCDALSFLMWKIDVSFDLLDDADVANITSKIVETTISSIEDTTVDDDEHDEDPAIPEHERNDEINDSEKIVPTKVIF